MYLCYDGDITISMIPLVCELVNLHDNPKALQHTNIKWVSLGEITEYASVAVDVMVLVAYLKWKSQSILETNL